MPWQDVMQGLSGATRGNNHGITAYCAHPGWYPKGSSGSVEEDALLVSATGDSLGALQG